MQAYKKNWRLLRSEFPIRSILDAYAGGFFYGFLIFGPIYLIVAELMMIFIYRLYTWVILLMVFVALNGWVVHRLAEKAFRLKNPETQVHYRSLRVVHLSLWGGFVILIGCLFIFWLIPTLWV